jgi:putative hydrolase of the HAD superfamily
MEDWELSDDRLQEVLNNFDIENVKKCGGFAKECFPNALVETYLYYCAVFKRKQSRKHIKELEDLGWKVLYEKPVVVDGARELLKKLKQAYRLFLITKGDQDLQLLKISQSGLGEFFYQVYVVLEKDCRVYQQLIGEHGIAAHRSWSVGNSIKADINPALAAGINCIHVLAPSWDFEYAEPIGEYYSVKNLHEVAEILLSEGG